MNLAAVTDPSPLRVDEHGVVRVGGSRVMLERVVHAFDDGASAEEIVERYPSLDLADVFATLAYVLRHRPEIDEYMRRSEAEAAETLRLVEERSPAERLRETLKQRAGRQSEG